MLARIARDPLFVFAVAGFALYAGYALLQSRDTEPVRLTAATRAALVGDFEAVTGRKASAADIARIERSYVADELLYREALDGGLHLTDSVVRGKLIEETRYRVTGVLPDPTLEQLVDHYSEHLDRYRTEPSVSFEQVYFAARPTDAEAVLALLRQGATVTGDPFAHGREFPRYGQSMVRGIFGQPFVAAAWAAPPATWTGPVESPQGWHFLRVTERLPAALLPFDAVRDQVENDFLVAVIREAVDRHVAELEQRYQVVIER